MHRNRLLTTLSLLLLIGAGNAEAAPCGPIPAQYPMYGADEIDIDDDVTMNGTTISSGTTGGNSVVEIDANRSVAPLTMPDLDPATYPANSSSLDQDDRDGPFVASTDVYYDRITIRNGQTTSFNGGGPFHIRELRVEDDATVNMAAGIYYIDNLHMHGDDSTLNVASEPVIIHVSDRLNAHGKRARLNPGGSVAGLRIFLRASVDAREFDDDTEFTGLLYGFNTDEIRFGKRSKIRGAVITKGEIRAEDDTTWIYTAADQALLAGVSTCFLTDHFAVLHDGLAAVCDVESVTIAHHQPFHGVNTSYSGTATLSTSTGNGTWTLLSGSGTLTNLGGGSATYAFAGADNGQVQLGLRDNVVETVNIDVTDGTDTETASEDADLVFGGTSMEDYRDEFNSVSYANNDGILSFSGNWIEVDSDGAGPGAGNAQINAGELRLDDFPNTDIDTSLARQADLSSHASASLAFDYRTSTGVDNNDSLFLEVSDNGGASWTLLEHFIGISGATSGSRSYDISGYIATNTRVRFRVDGLNGTGGTTCCYGASNETFYVDHFRIEVPSPAMCGPDHFSIEHDGTAVTCQEEPVTITAHDVTEGTDTGYTGTVALSTSTTHGDWSVITGAGTLVNSGTGNATYAFSAADNGVVVLGLKGTYAETANVNLDDGTANESSSEDPDLVFTASGFNVLADGVSGAVGTQIGGKDSNVPPAAQSLELQGIRTSDDTGACEAALAGPTSIDLAFECLDPLTCSGRLMTVNGSAVAANNAGAPLTYVSVNLDFGDATDDTAPIVISYPDVGRVRLHARTTLSPSGETMIGASNAFVSRPFGFDLSAAGNPAAVDENGPIYTTAGSDLAVTAKAVLWSAGDDTNADGIPDGHGDANPTNNVLLNDNLDAPGFGQESSAEGVLLSSSLLDPAAGADPGLGGTSTISSFVSGVGTTPDVYWDEVGIIELVAAVADGNYLGIGAGPTTAAAGRSGRVGRFTPHTFDVAYNVPSFNSGCAGFSYVGQPFSYSVTPEVTFTAQSLHLTTTQNYSGNWFKLTAADLTGLDYDAASGTLSAPAPNAPSIADLTGGVGTLTFDTGPTLSFNRTTPVAPFNAEISLEVNVIDGDSITYAANPAKFADTTTGIAFSAGKQMRFGRLVFENAFGSELSPLPVPLRAEYWTGSYFTPNTADVCSSAVSTSLTMTPDPLALASVPSMGPLLSAGDAGLVLSQPGAGNTGLFDLIFDLSPTGQNEPWLFGDWDGDGSYDDNPTGRATFGVFSGSDQLIYRREVY